MDVEAAKQLGIAVAAGSVVVAILAAVFIRKALTKAVVILVLGALMVLSLGQRANVERCAKEIRKNYETGLGGTTVCTVLGREFSVSVPTTIPTEVIDASSGPVDAVVDAAVDAADAAADGAIGATATTEP